MFNVEPLRSIDRVVRLVSYFVDQERECRLKIFGTAKGLNQLGLDVLSIRTSVIDGSINGNVLAAAISTVRTAVAHGVVPDVHGIAATLPGYLVAFDTFSARCDFLEQQLQTLRFEAQTRDALRKLLAS